jgi:hypothetical protein
LHFFDKACPTSKRGRKKVKSNLRNAESAVSSYIFYWYQYQYLGWYGMVPEGTGTRYLVLVPCSMYDDTADPAFLRLLLTFFQPLLDVGHAFSKKCKKCQMIN